MAVAVKSTVPGAHTAAGFVIATIGKGFTVVRTVPILKHFVVVSVPLI